MFRRRWSLVPEWWTDKWWLADRLATLFNQPVEVHTFELGALLGVLLATQVVRRLRRTVLVVTLVLVLATFGALKAAGLCSDHAGAYQLLQLQSWCFPGGFVAAHRIMIGLFGALVGEYAPPEWQVRSAIAPQSALVVAALVALALVVEVDVGAVAGLGPESVEKL